MSDLVECLILLAIVVMVFILSFDMGRKEGASLIKSSAIEACVAEYYIDADHEKQFRLLEVSQ